MALTKEKKEYIVLGIVLLAIVFVLYSYLGKGSSTPDPEAVKNTSTENLQPVVTPGTQHARKVLDLNSIGSSLNTAVLQDPRFKYLVTPAYPIVDKSEVGLQNPFVGK
ncbi:MAG: hypothetical protein G01um101477_92 [Candidatus Doudnabacteria bacterium Gr01-1014_77]|uniref:Uncharacterized protein n=1 Tax=Candidatus Doudnabacteria bacterium Gr01-1014_77 TaxID=2017133 RepID=A0A554JDH9_9BACT|nr:MAG: hypothetical protein G01um101477_92 [Candidatus Doudnabacteria bacterium Gr01-1014_77]